MFLQSVRPTPATLNKSHGDARSVMPSGLVTAFITAFITVFPPWRRFV